MIVFLWVGPFYLAVLPQDAQAGNDDGVLIGDDAALTGGAVTATASNGAALWYNPAGVVGSDQRSLDVSGTAYTLRIRKSPSLLVDAEGNRGDGGSSEFVVVPAAVTYVRPFSRLRIALGVFQPQASDLSLRAQMDAADTRWLLNINERISETHVVAGVAYRIHDHLYFGATVGVFALSLSRSGQIAGARQGDERSFSTRSGLRSISGQGLSASVGMQWQASSRFRLGLSIRTPGLLVRSSYRIEEVSSGGPARGGAIVEQAGSRWGADLAAPARIRLGIAYTHPRFSASLDGDYQHAMTAIAPDWNRNRVVNVRVGIRASVSELVNVGFGLFTDRSSLRAVQGFLDTNVDFYGGTLGVSFDSIRKLDVAAENIERLYFGTTLAVRYAYGRGDVGGFRVDTGLAAADPAVPLATSQTVHEIGLNLAARLRF